MTKEISKVEKQRIPWFWPVTSTIALLLSFSFYANHKLWQRAKDHYIGANATRLDPVGLKAFADSEIPATSELTRVVFFGDSRAASWPSPIREATNQTRNVEFFNRGLGSQTSTQALQRFQTHVAPLRPDVVIIQIGINDIKAIGLFPKQTSTILSEVVANIEQIVKQAEATGAVVVLSSIFPIGEVTWAKQLSVRSRPFWLSNTINPAVATVNQSLKTLVSVQNNDSVIWFDSSSLLIDETGKISRDYLIDELHLNEKGYAILNQALSERLQSLTPTVEVTKPLTAQENDLK